MYAYFAIAVTSTRHAGARREPSARRTAVPLQGPSEALDRGQDQVPESLEIEARSDLGVEGTPGAFAEVGDGHARRQPTGELDLDMRAGAFDQGRPCDPRHRHGVMDGRFWGSSRLPLALTVEAQQAEHRVCD